MKWVLGNALVSRPRDIQIFVDSWAVDRVVAVEALVRWKLFNAASELAWIYMEADEVSRCQRTAAVWSQRLRTVWTILTGARRIRRDTSPEQMIYVGVPTLHPIGMRIEILDCVQRLAYLSPSQVAVRIRLGDEIERITPEIEYPLTGRRVFLIREVPFRVPISC